MEREEVGGAYVSLEVGEGAYVHLGGEGLS